MDTKQSFQYERIAKAIHYIVENYRFQPSLEEMASAAHLSPMHFQRLFTAWAGTSPKKFLQYISLGHAKTLLHAPQTTLFEVTHELGLSSSSRLHDLFVQIEGMTPAQYKNAGKGIEIHYSFQQSPFGQVIVGSTHRGLCYMAFGEDSVDMLQELKQRFPQAQFVATTDEYQRNALAIFEPQQQPLQQVKLHLKGSDFQLKVWESLLKIPLGQLSTYGALAKQIGQATAARAVGTAIGNNPIAYLIPCHRVIQATGALGGYMWGKSRKAAIIGWEAAQVDKNIDQEQQS